MQGYFITFEGPDGSGKTTQIDLLEEYLIGQGHRVLVTREPGGTAIGEAIRDIILDRDNQEMDAITEMLLYAASRAQHVSQLIRPALEAGKIVLCDRFVDSSIAYQGFGRGLGMEIVERANRIALQGILPDLTLFFDIDPEEGLRRGSLRDRQADRLEMENLDFHRRVYKGFKALCVKYPQRFRNVKAGLTIDEIKSQILNIISELPNYGK